MKDDIAGAWHPIAASLSGQSLAVNEMRVAHLQLGTNHYHIHDRSGAVVDQGRFSLDRSVVPWALDLQGEQGLNAANTLRALCELVADGSGQDVLTICYALDGGARPQSFADAEVLADSAETARLHLTLRFRRLACS